MGVRRKSRRRLVPDPDRAGARGSARIPNKIVLHAVSPCVGKCSVITGLGLTRARRSAGAAVPHRRHHIECGACDTEAMSYPVGKCEIKSNSLIRSVSRVAARASRGTPGRGARATASVFFIDFELRRSFVSQLFNPIIKLVSHKSVCKVR